MVVKVKKKPEEVQKKQELATVEEPGKPVFKPGEEAKPEGVVEEVKGNVKELFTKEGAKGVLTDIVEKTTGVSPEDKIVTGIAPTIGGIGGEVIEEGGKKVISRTTQIIQDLKNIHKTRKGNKIADIVRQDRRVKDIAKVLKINAPRAESVRKILDTTPKDKFFKLMDDYGKFAVKLGVSTAVGSTMLAIWMGGDNIITGARFSSNTAVSSLRFNEITPEQAIEFQEEAKADKAAADKVVMGIARAIPDWFPIIKTSILNSNATQTALENNDVILENLLGLGRGLGEEEEAGSSLSAGAQAQLDAKNAANERFNIANENVSS